jgi:hypothetical protein
MHIRRFEKMHADFVEICDRTYKMGTNSPFIVELLQSTPYTNVCIFMQCRLPKRVRCVSINPLLYFNEACTIINFVGNVGGLCRDGADLSDKCYL